MDADNAKCSMEELMWKFQQALPWLHQDKMDANGKIFQLP